MFYYSTFLWLSLSAGCCDSLFLLFDFTFFTIIACINRAVKTRWDEICSSSIIINIIAMGIFSISFQTPPRSSWIVRKFSSSLRIFISTFMTGMCEWKHLSRDNSDEKMYKHFMRQLFNNFSLHRDLEWVHLLSDFINDLVLTASYNLPNFTYSSI